MNNIPSYDQKEAASRPHPETIIGQKAPVFSARSTQGPVSMNDFRGKWLILFFHPADFTPVCTTEFAALTRRQAEFDALDVKLMGISVDSVYSHLAWINFINNKYGVSVDFPVVEDISMVIAKSYGLVNDDSNSTEGVRACCFINPEGVVEAKIHYPMQIGRSIDELLRVQHALINVRESGMTCPADWQKGEDMLAYPSNEISRDDPSWLDQALENYKNS